MTRNKISIVLILGAILFSTCTANAQEFNARRISREITEYAHFLSTQFEEAEEPCEQSEYSTNPLIRKWHERFCG